MIFEFNMPQVTRNQFQRYFGLEGFLNANQQMLLFEGGLFSL